MPGNILKALGGRGKRKYKISSNEVIFTKADESSSMPIPEITSDSESECKTHEPLPPLPKLIGAAPAGTSNSLIFLADLTLNMADLTLNTFPEKKADLSIEQLLLTLMDEVKSLKEQIKVPSENSPSVSQTRSSKSSKGKQTTWFGPCKHYGFKNHLAKDCYIKPKCSTCGSTEHLTKEHLKQTVVNKSLTKLKAQSSMNPSAKKAPMIPKPFKDYSGCSINMTRVKQYLHKYSKESGPKVVFGYNSSGDTEGYGLVNYNGITFTNGTIFNQNDEVVLNSPRIKDVYVIDMSSYNEESNACFFVKASPSVNWLWHKRLSHLNFKNINKLGKQNLVAGLPSLTFSKPRIVQRMSTQGTPRSVIVKRHGKTASDVFRGRSDIIYFHMFGCPVHIHNHIDHLEMFDEKLDDGFFLGYSLVAKAFRVFNIRRQEMEETCHVTFNEDDEAISQSSTEGDAINFNKNRSFPDDEFLEPRNKVT
ncbi:retrovirus-related pol polyprotein from transposon TNT 1-94 [Tanacetum coccineum]